MTIHLTHANTYDGGVRGRWRDATVVVDGTQITGIFEPGAAPAPAAGDTVIDLTGKTLMPGLFNCHAHLGWDGYGDLQEQSEEAAQHPVRAGLRCAYDLRGCLEAGVTTIRDLGVHHTGLASRNMVRRGIIAGPRVIPSAAAIACTGGHTWWAVRQADGPVDCRRAVREQMRAGAEWIKVMASGHEPQEFTDEEIQAMAHEAHLHGLPITAHATYDPSARACVLAGFDSLEHGGNYAPDVEDLIVERGVWITPTFSPLTMQARHGIDWGMKPADVERRRKTLENPVRLLGVARLRKKGAKLAFGTDSGSPVVPHNDIVSEMEALLEFGVFEKVEQILEVATKRSAEMLRVLDTTGTIEAGKRADLAIAHGDPLTNLQDLRRIDKVFVGGKLVVDAGTVRRGM